MAGQHPYAPWRRVVLVPCWIIQILFPGVTFILLALAMVVLARSESDNINVKVTLGVAGLYVFFCGLCVALTIVEIVLLLQRKLKPLVFMIFNFLKSLTWTIFFILRFLPSTQVNGKTPTVVNLVIDVILLVAFYVPLVHGAIIFHHHERGTTYEPVDAKRFSDMSGIETASIKSAYKPFITEIDLESNPSSMPFVPAKAPGRRLSYNHTRDQRFDVYKSGRRSLSDPHVVGLMSGSPIETPDYLGRSRSSTIASIPEVVVHDHDEQIGSSGASVSTDSRMGKGMRN